MQFEWQMWFQWVWMRSPIAILLLRQGWRQIEQSMFKERHSIVLFFQAKDSIISDFIWAFQNLGRFFYKAKRMKSDDLPDTEDTTTYRYDEFWFTLTIQPCGFEFVWRVSELFMPVIKFMPEFRKSLPLSQIMFRQFVNFIIFSS